MINTVRDQVREALGELRLTVGRLRSPIETDLPIMQSISKLVQDFEVATGLPVGLEISGEFVGLPNEHRLAIYRAVQEGLTNIQRHSKAEKAHLRLVELEKEIHLEICDDGIGPQPENPEGFGLHGMRERVEQMGGTMVLNKMAEGGSRLSISIPMPGEFKYG
jgi:signal transduction histidine kinase